MCANLQPFRALWYISTTYLRPRQGFLQRPASQAFATDRQRRAVLSLTPAAVQRLRELQTSGTLLRIGVRSRGCSGLAYSLEQVACKEAMDEHVEQDGVSVLVESRALLSVIGSEMDFVRDELSSQFVFRNPNARETCGCGHSFTT